MALGRNKGASFERELSKELSLWWTDGKRDDIFWRTAASGGRFTSRMKRGKNTAGQAGDIMSQDPKGRHLTQLLLIEAKRGHKDCSASDAFDRPTRIKPRWWEVFINKARREARKAGIPFWCLIIRRDKRNAVIHFSYAFLRLLEKETKLRRRRCKAWQLTQIDPANGAKDPGLIVAILLSDFLRMVKPEKIKELAREHRK